MVKVAKCKTCMWNFDISINKSMNKVAIKDIIKICLAVNHFHFMGFYKILAQDSSILFANLTTSIGNRCM